MLSVVTLVLKTVAAHERKFVCQSRAQSCLKFLADSNDMATMQTV